MLTIPKFNFNKSATAQAAETSAAISEARAALEQMESEIKSYVHPSERAERPDSIEAALRLLDSKNLLVAPNGMPLNERQREYVANVVCGRDVVLIGAAGTGKTTAVQASMKALLALGLVGTIPKASLKHVYNENAPAMIACAFTNRAARNIATKLPAGMEDNSMTHHKLCEYVPVDKNSTETKRFVPSRNAANPLPELDVVFYEEASMLDYELYKIQEAAYSPSRRPTEVTLGDMYQLPPIFGASLLAMKLLDTPVIELTEVYRQAMDSPIIRLAHAIKDGVAISPLKRNEYTKPGELDILYLPNGEALHLAMQLGVNFFKLMEAGEFQPSTDTVLVPNNKNFGQITINRSFNAELDRKYGAPVDPDEEPNYAALQALAPKLWSDFPEMMARVEDRKFKGFRPYKIQAGHLWHYISEGDRVLYGSREAVVLEVIRNAKFKKPVMIGRYTRWGKELDDLDLGGGDFALSFTSENASEDPFDLDMSVEDIAGEFETEDGEKEKAENQASYILVLQLDDGSIVNVETRGDMNSLNGAIATTVHKSQGLEFRRVYLLLHRSCGRLLCNEIAYTGITRARESLVIMCEKDSLSTAAKRRQIQGRTLAEKVAWIHEQLAKQAASGKFDEAKGG